MGGRVKLLDNLQTILENSKDKDLSYAVLAEMQRQEDHIELIASENYVSEEVLALQGSLLTNKYAEGYPGKRYYGGCEFVDIVENLAIQRVKDIFGSKYANVQPHSGTQANMAVYFKLLNHNDSVLAMSLDQGGHLTHGSPVNLSGKTFKFYFYGLDENGDIDYKAIENLAKEHKPKMIIAGFSAFSGLVDWERISVVAKEYNAYFMVDMAHVAGLIATGLYPNPVKFADIVTSTTHKTLRGPRGGIILCNSFDIYKKIQSSVFPASQGGPLMHVIAAKARAFFEAMQDDFKEYQLQVLKNSSYLAEKLKHLGIKIVSNGTKNHMFLIDLSSFDLSGKEIEESLGRAFITVNKNTIPNDPKSPMITSGIRMGTPAITTRGFKESECEVIVNCIYDIIQANFKKNDLKNTEIAVKSKILDLCKRFPVYKRDKLINLP